MNSGLKVCDVLRSERWNVSKLFVASNVCVNCVCRVRNSGVEHA